MKRYLGLWKTFVTSLSFVVIAEGAGAGEYINFITCPIVRDVGPEVDVCFYSDYQGQTYHLQPIGLIDAGEPQLKHRLLVEGEVVEGEHYCGGKRFTGRITVLPEVDLSCNSYTPFDGVIIGQQRSDKRADHPKYQPIFREMKTRPEVSIEPVPVSVPTADAIEEEKTTGEESFTLYFAFNQDRLDGVTAGKLLTFTERGQARFKRLELTSYQAETKLDNGERLPERLGMAKQRAEKMIRILTGIGIDRDIIDVTVVADNLSGQGQHDWKNRRITLIGKRE